MSKTKSDLTDTILRIIKPDHVRQSTIVQQQITIIRSVLCVLSKEILSENDSTQYMQYHTNNVYYNEEDCQAVEIFFLLFKCGLFPQSCVCLL